MPCLSLGCFNRLLFCFYFAKGLRACLSPLTTPPASLSPSGNKNVCWAQQRSGGLGGWDDLENTQDGTRWDLAEFHTAWSQDQEHRCWRDPCALSSSLSTLLPQLWVSHASGIRRTTTIKPEQRGKSGKEGPQGEAPKCCARQTFRVVNSLQ